MTRGPLRGVLLSCGACLLLLGAPDSVPAEAGRVEVRVADHRAGIADFSALWVELVEVSVHRAGQPRGAGWVEVVHRGLPVDIVPLKDGRSAPVGSAMVKAVRYDAVRVRFGQIQGTLRNRGRAGVVPLGSTVLIDLDVEPGASRVVVVDLYVEDQSDHEPGRYALKVRDATVIQMGETR